MQYAKELVNAALAKGEQALTQLQVAVQTGANSSVLAVRTTSMGSNGGSSSTSNSLPNSATSQAQELRVQRFKQELRGSRINVDALKRLAFDGVPDKDGLRIVVWKVLLGYLPPCPDEWAQSLARRRTQYHVFCSELIVDPKRPMQQDGSLHAPPQPGVSEPLASIPTSPSPSATPRTSASQPVMSASSPALGHSPTTRLQATQPTNATQPRESTPAHAAQPHTQPHVAQVDAGPLGGGGASNSQAAQQQDPLQSNTSQAAPDPMSAGAIPPVSLDVSPFQRRPLQKQVSVKPQPLPAQQHKWQPQEWLCEQESNCSDHPLSLDAGSKWRTFFQDNETLEQITRDVMRTHPDMEFFTGESEEAELHRQEMRRALFMYAKLNSGLRYIQGMNELIAPLYHLFKHDPQPKEREFAEADAFWCFLELISEFRDHFCQQLDNAQTGIRATIRRLMHVLQHCDYELWHHIEVECKVDPQYYAFRWITLLLSQEFPFPVTLRIWDTILSDPHGRMDCLLRICTAMILNIKPKLMQGDFTVILTTLQRYPPVDVEQLLNAAAALPACQDILGQPV